VFSEASVSSDGLTGEAVIDLTAANLIPAGTCEGFQQAYAKARSSTSLTAEMKDFISPGPAHFNTCGATEVIKLSSKQGGGGLNGATFVLKDSNGATVATVTTGPAGGANGIACVAGLPLGTYTWTETKAPANYSLDDPSPHTVNVDHPTDCSNSPVVATFFDTPLSQVEVKFTSLAGTTVTKAAIVCSNASGTVAAVSENGQADNAFDDTDEVFTNLKPGLLTCTVNIDP
jgi:uncharacterized surface anchored protein